MPLNFLNLKIFRDLNIYIFNFASQNIIILVQNLWSKKRSHGSLISGKLYGAIAKPKVLRVATKAHNSQTYL